ncbi:MAG: HyaD/HybD family hydrogenase maturation endopeptidase [Gammaproteobacteria bacterium]
MASWLEQRSRERFPAGSLAVEDAGAVYEPIHSAIPLVLGFGNVLLGDDGAGVHVAERLRAELGSAAANFLDAGTLSFSLLSLVEAADSLLVIDAGDLDSPPGTVALFEGAAMDQFLKSTRRRTVHEVGLIDLLDMARVQDCLPCRRALLCIQPQRIDWSEALSPTVAASLVEAARQATALLQRWST